MKIFNKDTEKYYICENCGTLRSESEFNNDKTDRLAYGNKICNCEYGYIRWDEKSNSFLPQYGKTFIPYIEIPKDIYTILKAEENEILRMRMYNDWRKKVLSKNDKKKR
jgi:hypothetical protein